MRRPGLHSVRADAPGSAVVRAPPQADGSKGRSGGKATHAGAGQGAARSVQRRVCGRRRGGLGRPPDGGLERSPNATRGRTRHVRTELQRRRRPLIWVAPAGEAEEVSASRAPHARRSALHPAAWHGQQRPTKTRPRRGRRRSGRSSHGPRTAGLHFRGVFPASRLPLETRRAGGGTGGTQSRSRPRRAGAAMPRRPQRGKGVRSTTSSPRRAKHTNHLPPPPRRLHGAPVAPRQRRALSAGRPPARIQVGGEGRGAEDGVRGTTSPAGARGK